MTRSHVDTAVRLSAGAVGHIPEAILRSMYYAGLVRCVAFVRLFQMDAWFRKMRLLGSVRIPPSLVNPFIVRHITIEIETRGKGTVEITQRVRDFLANSGIAEGILTVFVSHTSCSLVIMENADPSARRDLHEFFDRLVPEDTPWFQHTCEGPDDMPSHIRMALTRSSESIPVSGGRMLLGTWQGLFLFEHRRAPHTRQVTITVMGR